MDCFQLGRISKKQFSRSHRKSAPATRLHGTVERVWQCAMVLQRVAVRPCARLQGEERLQWVGRNPIAPDTFMRCDGIAPCALAGTTSLDCCTQPCYASRLASICDNNHKLF